MYNEKLKIEKIYLYIMFFLVPFFAPWWFTKVKFMDIVLDAWKLIIISIIFINLVKCRIRFTKLTLIFTLYRLFICGVSIYRNNFSTGYFIESIQWIAFLIILEYLLMTKGSYTIQIILFCFTFNLLLNMATYAPNGMILDRNSGIYLLGIRTSVSALAIPSIGLALYYSIEVSKSSKYLIFILLSSIPFFLLEWVATPITCTLLLILMLLVNKLVNKKLKKIYQIIILLLSIGISVGIVFFNVQEYFSYIISEILHKSVTFTGRTDLWDIAKEYIKNNWIIGYGYQNQGNFISMYDFITTSHNQWLQTMFYGGIVGTVLYFSLTLISINKIIIKQNYSYSNFSLIATLSVIIIMCTTEISMDNIYYLTFICVIFHADKVHNSLARKLKINTID